MSRLQQIVNRHMARLLKNLEDISCPSAYLDSIRHAFRWLRSDLVDNESANTDAILLDFFEASRADLCAVVAGDDRDGAEGYEWEVVQDDGDGEFVIGCGATVRQAIADARGMGN